MKFAIPEGMVPPDGVTVGSTFDALATLKLGEADLELIAVDGLPVAGSETPEPAEAPEATSEEMGFEEAIRSGMMEG
jgi:hypothetical protein